MRLLAYAHPAILREGAEFNGSWTELLSQMLVPLARAESEVQLTILTGARFLRRLPPDLPENVTVACVDEFALHRDLSALDCTLGDLTAHIMSEDWGHPTVRCLLRHVEDALPPDRKFDAIVSFAMKAGWLRQLSPSAVIFHSEMGPFSKAPFPPSLFLDSEGIYDTSTIVQAAKTRSLPIPAASDIAWLTHFRMRYEEALSQLNPFKGSLLREQYSRSYLLPLQVSGSFTFDEIAPYRSQLEYVVDVLAQTPRDTGVMVTEYTEWSCLLNSKSPSKSLMSLRRFPNFVKLSRDVEINSPSPYIVPMVDGVWTTSSNVAWHAILWQKNLGVPTAGFHAPLADAHNIPLFCEMLSREFARGREELLIWALGHYYIPFSLCMNPRWLAPYLRSRIESHRVPKSWRWKYFRGSNGIENYPKLADWEVLTATWQPIIPRRPEQAPTRDNSPNRSGVHPRFSQRRASQ